MHIVLWQMAEAASKSIYNWRRYPSLKCYEIDEKVQSEFGGLLSRNLTSQRKTTMWLHNYSPSPAQWPQRYFGKFTFCMTFGVHKLVRSEPFLDYLYEIWRLLSVLYRCKKKYIYRCTSTFSALNYWWRIFDQFLQLLGAFMRKVKVKVAH